MYPWLCGVEVNALDPLGSGKELPLQFGTSYQPLMNSLACMKIDRSLCCASLRSYLNVQTHLRDSHSARRYNELSLAHTNSFVVELLQSSEGTSFSPSEPIRDNTKAAKRRILVDWTAVVLSEICMWTFWLSAVPCQDLLR